MLGSLCSSGFRGAIYPVNPQATQIGQLKAYASLRELPESPDLVVICVPRHLVAGVVDGCADVGVRSVVVVTAGFAETDAEGRELEAELRRRISGRGIRMVGPNCVGLLNTDPAVRLNTTFSPIEPLRGGVALGSQSGAIGLAVMAAARRLHVGFSSFVSVGNEADVSCADLLEYWAGDGDTEVILLYMESLAQGQRFAEAAARVSRHKPIVLLHAGRTLGGQRAAGSHTAALATSQTLVDAMFRRSGMIRADTLEELLDLAATLSQQPLPAGQRVAIITNAGGPAVLCTDAIEQADSTAPKPGVEPLRRIQQDEPAGSSTLFVPEFTAQTVGLLRQFIPLPASVANPVDMTAAAGPHEYRRATETVLASDEVDAVVVIYIPIEMVPNPQFIAAVSDGVRAVRLTGSRAKPLVACVFSQEGRQPPLSAGGHTIPCFLDPAAAARVLRKLSSYAQWRTVSEGTVPALSKCDADLARRICLQAVEQRGAGWLRFAETRDLLGAFGFPMVATELVQTPDAAAAAAARLGFPAVLKVVSTRIVHKTDLGMVRLNLPDADSARQACQEILEHAHDLGLLPAVSARAGAADSVQEGVIVQPMLCGLELMAGAVRDPAFGAVIGFGLGGLTVELLNDLCWRLAPLSDREAANMVRDFRSAPLLTGYRGRPPVDIRSLEDLLLRLSQLMETVPQIRQVDFNPIIAQPGASDASIVDARIAVC